MMQRKRSAMAGGGAPGNGRSPLALAMVLALLSLVALLPAQSAQAQLQSRQQPEAGSGRTAKPLATARRHMVAAAHPLAAEAGRDILRRGGSAADAAITTLLVLNLVEPQSSGIGGGAFALAHDARSGKLGAYDGRETAPAAARPDRFLIEGRPMAYLDAVHSGRSIGVPGLVLMLAALHADAGRLPWRELFQPAIRLARDGFQVSPRLNGLLNWAGPARFDAAARAYFFDAEGRARPVGYRMVNAAFADTLERIAEAGSDAFYRGAIADAIAAAAAAAPRSLGDLTTSDLAAYRAIRREPGCAGYRGRRVCGVGPPSSGGPTVAQVLMLIEPFRAIADSTAPLAVDAVHILGEAQKLAYADRDLYIADPSFVKVPGGLLDPGYVAQRRRLITTDRAMAKPAAGRPPGLDTATPGADGSVERDGTTHVSIIDGEGNAVSVTATIEGAFGSGIMAAGFLLNNQLTDFAFRPIDDEARAVANRVEGGKRPRSSMAPTIVYGVDGAVETVLGSPGGNRIILYVVKAIVAMIDWRLDAAEAAALANFGNRGHGFELERDTVLDDLAQRLSARGHAIVRDDLTSGLHIVRRRGGGLEGGADPRREGVALGD